MASQFPEPLVIPPRKLPHKQTFILLHGRGSSGEKFGLALLETAVEPPRLRHVATPSPSSASTPGIPATSASTLSTIFPHARFVFPFAVRRRATVYRRAYTHQWFDNWKLDPPATDREELQVPGLVETTTYLHGLLRDEIATVPGGAQNVLFGGLSQGCAASLIALLLWEGEPLGAALGMCGWLPFAFRLNEQMHSISNNTKSGGEEQVGIRDTDEGFDPFQRDEDGTGDRDVERSGPDILVTDWLREELEIPQTFSESSELSVKKTPVFLGHGAEDDRVHITLGRDAYNCLKGIGVDVSWHEYELLGHWYSGYLLRDFVEFIGNRTDWPNID